MMSKQTAWMVVAMLGSLQPSYAAPPPGAASCSGCHVLQTTVSAVPTILPSIYGRPADDIFAAMIAFRDGTRPATVMNRIAKGFTDDELRAIAAWLATQK